ncbi:MAG: hypothetical protein NTZ51_09450 [Proteobacteria bacterium]|nr:hypothetical protein [Pseudomonadota bacterium]
MKNKKTIISKRLAEVWEWKDAAYREVADLPTEQALGKLLEKAHGVAKKYKLRYSSPSKAFAVREEQRAYKKK